MAGNEEQPIIIKKVVVSGEGHHGGSWKVAYADFVTAMMAFFLLLWLLNVTTDEQKNGIADYFAPTTVSLRTSGAGGILGGQTMSVEGSRTSDRSSPAVVLELAPPETPKPVDEENDREEAGGGEDAELTEEELLKRMAEREQKEFEAAEQALREAIEGVPELTGFSEQLVIENTPEGLRIQLLDQDGRSMFPSGKAGMHEHMRQLLAKVAEVIQRAPNQLAISGHTDATPFKSKNGYGNWELSADRANASRRALVDSGIDPHRISSVSGKAETEPYLPDAPADAANRRITITLLREVPLQGGANGAAATPQVGPAPGVGPAPTPKQ